MHSKKEPQTQMLQMQAEHQMDWKETQMQMLQIQSENLQMHLGEKETELVCLFQFALFWLFVEKTLQLRR
jgi:hypothetical protein